MEYLATAEEMQKIDTITMNEIGIPALVLMERAALKTAEEIAGRFDKNKKCLVVVESGNNGGDGLAVARILKSWNYHVDVCHIAGISKESESFTKQKQILIQLGIPILHEIPDEEYDVIVDGIFGVGLKRPVTGIQKQVIGQINRMKGYKIAIDVPSGLYATSGQIADVCVMADLTVTFGLCKVGMLRYPGRDYCGEIVVKDIGFPKNAIEQVDPVVYTYDQSCLCKLPPRTNDSNKGTYGRVSVIAGSSHMSGAAYLAAEAVYRMGCGLVKVYTHEQNRTILGTKLPEAILMTYSDEVSIAACVDDAINFGDVILIGPGLGMDELAFSLVKTVLERSSIPLIIDADGLNILSKHMDWLEGCRGPVILTPHLKEMSRLNGQTVSEIKQNTPEYCQSMAANYHLVCVLKDARTWVSDGTNKLYMNVSGNNGMSTAGAGDVLSGIIAGLAGLGMASDEAARLGVYIHGRAGDFAAEKKGQYSMIARDILDGISQVLGGI